MHTALAVGPSFVSSFATTCSGSSRLALVSAATVHRDEDVIREAFRGASEQSPPRCAPVEAPEHAWLDPVYKTDVAEGGFGPFSAVPQRED